jgi:hypothetical protein
VSTTTVEQGADWQILWDGCVQCGAPTPCRQWIVATASAGRPVLTCEQYPCFCLATRKSAPDWVEEATCWWLSKKTGKLESRCPCWGRQRDDTLPGDCCSNHEANPAHAVEHLEAGIRRPVAAAEAGSTDVSEAPEHAMSARAATGATTGQQAAYTRLWTPSEVTCDCKTPWDADKRAGGGHHCVACHVNFVNDGVSAAHQRDVRDPCRDPKSIVDIDTGRRLLYARDVRGAMVWAFAW